MTAGDGDEGWWYSCFCCEECILPISSRKRQPALCFVSSFMTEILNHKCYIGVMQNSFPEPDGYKYPETFSIMFGKL